MWEWRMEVGEEVGGKGVGRGKGGRGPFRGRHRSPWPSQCTPRAAPPNGAPTVLRQEGRVREDKADKDQIKEEKR
jgi:hypothetical protein